MQKTDSLTANQKRAIAALLSEPTIERAASTAKLSERTLYRYLSTDSFRAELRRRQDSVLAAAVASLAGAVGDAVATLCDVMSDKLAAPGVRVRAASVVLDKAVMLAEYADLEERIASLEAATDVVRIREVIP